MPYIGNQPGTGVRSRFIYTATASQTTFTGADNNSKTLKYSDADYIDVYLNGVCLVPGTDYTASTKTSVVLIQAASLNDTLEVVAYDIATISDTVSKADGGTFEDGVTIRTADNTTQLTLESTDADANSGPVLELYRNSSSPAGDDVLGEIEFHGENDADEKIQYGLIAAKLQDAADGTEDVRLSFKTITAGTERERVTIQPSEVVINEDSQDLDFRVEGDSNTNALFVRGSDNRVGIGLGDPDAALDVSKGTNALGILRLTQRLTGAAAYGLDMGLDSSTGDPVFSRIVNDTVTEAFRIQRSTGNLTTQDVSVFARNTAGFTARKGDSTCIGRTSGTPLEINRSDGGNLVNFFVGGTSEGVISVSGNTVSYGSFTGSHWSRLSDNSKPTILRGTVMETIDEMCDWYKVAFTITDADSVGNVKKIDTVEEISLPANKKVGDTIEYTYDENGETYTGTIQQAEDEKHVKAKVSDTSESTKVYGVFFNWDNDDDNYNDMMIASLGTHVVRIKSTETVSAGDLLVSNGDGTAKVQDDDIIRSKTLGKVLTNIKQETYDDGSYTVPCALYCG